MTETTVASALAPTYKRYDLTFVRGQGAWLEDAHGKRYLDFLGGIAVNALGHQHPAVLRAIQEAAQGPIHVSNLYHNEPGERLAQALCRLSFADSVFLCNSGTEAIEGAIKFARKWKQKPDGRLVAFQGAFHGRSLGALSLTWNEKYRKPFEPLVPGVSWLPFNDVPALQQIDETVTAVVVEPVQGEGGVHPASQAFLQALRRRCDEVGAALVFDEIQCGLRRTGPLFAYQHYDVEPDILTLAKPLGGGFPIGAILMTGAVAGSLAAGDHGTTFGGGPFITHVALAVLETLAALPPQDEVSRILEQGLAALGTVRGCGHMWGLQLADSIPVDTVIAKAHAAGLLVGSSAGNTLRLLPPLVLTAEEARHGVAILHEVLK